MESVLQAVKSLLPRLSGKGKLILLLGGRDKNLPWQELSRLQQHADLHPVFFGECGEIAQRSSELSGPCFAKLSEALAHAKDLAVVDDIFLLSPRGSILDEFKNFEERGNFFRDWVQK